MKAIILAGGKGTRLRPLTNKTPKSLLKVDSKTLIEHILDILNKWGIKEVTLSVGYMARKIQDYFSDGSKFEIKINYAVEENLMGSAGPLYLIQKPEDTFLMLPSDCFFYLDFSDMIKFHKNAVREGAVATIALTKAGLEGHGGVKIENDKIVEFVEKPSPKIAKMLSSYINSAYYLMEPEILNYLPKKEFAMLETDVFPILAKEGKLFGYKDENKWVHISSLEDYKKVTRGEISLSF